MTVPSHYNNKITWSHTKLLFGSLNYKKQTGSKQSKSKTRSYPLTHVASSQNKKNLIPIERQLRLLVILMNKKDYHTEIEFQNPKHNAFGFWLSLLILLFHYAQISSLAQIHFLYKIKIKRNNQEWNKQLLNL